MRFFFTRRNSNTVSKDFAFLHPTVLKKMMYIYLVDIVLYCITADKEPYIVNYSQEFDPVSLPAGSVLISVRIPKLLKVMFYKGRITFLCTYKISKYSFIECLLLTYCWVILLQSLHLLILYLVKSILTKLCMFVFIF